MASEYKPRPGKNIRIQRVLKKMIRKGNNIGTGMGLYIGEFVIQRFIWEPKLKLNIFPMVSIGILQKKG